MHSTCVSAGDHPTSTCISAPTLSSVGCIGLIAPPTLPLLLTLNKYEGCAVRHSKGCAVLHSLDCNVGYSEGCTERSVCKSVLVLSVTLKAASGILLQRGLPSVVGVGRKEERGRQEEAEHQDSWSMTKIRIHE
eukprot:1159605-Pelagomonas_calceolata.AAC.6